MTSSNGNGRLAGWLKLALAVLIVLASGYGGFISLRTNVEAQAVTMDKICRFGEETRARTDANEKTIIRMQADIEYIKDGLDRNISVQEEILRELRKNERGQDARDTK